MLASITNRNCQSLSRRPERVTRRRRHLVGAIAFAALLVCSIGCGGSPDASPSAPEPAPTEPAPTEPAPTEPAEPAETQRQQLTSQQCEAQGGEVVGDIGDGATQRPDYTCPSGKPPTGNIAPAEGGPMPIEGAVCCPR